MPAKLPFPKSLPDFQRLFPDDAACAAYLERCRWAEAFACPHCQWAGEPYRFAARPGVLRCRGCQQDIYTGKTTYRPKLCRIHDARQTSLLVAGKIKTEIEHDFQNRLTRSIPNEGRERLALEIQDSGRPDPKQGGLF